MIETDKNKEVMAICRYCGREIYQDNSPCGFGEWYHKHNKNGFCILPTDATEAKPISDEDIIKRRTMDNIITRFFEGEEHFTQEDDRKVGFLWVAKHTGYDTLTFEPTQNTQNEIAMRFKVTPEKDDLNDEKWQGYVVADPFKDKLYGVNTRGH